MSIYLTIKNELELSKSNNRDAREFFLVVAAEETICFVVGNSRDEKLSEKGSVKQTCMSVRSMCYLG